MLILSQDVITHTVDKLCDWMNKTLPLHKTNFRFWMLNACITWSTFYKINDSIRNLLLMNFHLHMYWKMLLTLLFFRVHLWNFMTLSIKYLHTFWPKLIIMFIFLIKKVNIKQSWTMSLSIRRGYFCTHTLKKYQLCFLHHGYFYYP